MSMEMGFLENQRNVEDYKNLNNGIREKKNIKYSFVDYIGYKRVKLFCHLQRTQEGRLLRKVLEWCPLGRRRKGRLRNSWMQ